MSTLRSSFLVWAEAQRAEARAAWEDYRWAAYEAAVDATNGHMLNRRGQAAGVDTLSLFEGNETRALAYASDELREFWRGYGRIPITRFIEQYVNLTIER